MNRLYLIFTGLRGKSQSYLSRSASQVVYNEKGSGKNKTFKTPDNTVKPIALRRGAYKLGGGKYVFCKSVYQSVCFCMPDVQPGGMQHPGPDRHPYR
jgi:hypothetical protein